MKYREFKNKIQNFPVFLPSQITIFEKNEKNLLNQISRWSKQKLILKLKRGVYLLNDTDRKINPSRTFIANLLYPPSYISTEYALGFYGLIPERVADITSVTVKKTTTFKNFLGCFRYQHIKPECFKGYVEMKDENNFSFFIAEPAKAIVDFLYLNLSNFSISDTDIFELSYRFQNLYMVDIDKMRNFACDFGNKKLLCIAENFVKFVKGKR